MTHSRISPVSRPRRPRAVLAVLAALTVTASGCTPAASASPATPLPAAAAPAPAVTSRPPNLVFVLTDDLEPSLLRFMPTVRTMQAHGANFTHYTVSDSLCCPSRASIFTGQYPHTTGIFTNTAPDGGYVAFQRRGLEQHTFAVALQQQGYRTGFLGKYLNGYDPKAGTGRPGSNVPPGWDEWDVAGNGYPEFNYTLNENGREVAYGHRKADYLTDVLATKGQRFIRAQAAAGQPFALEVATFAPHSPYTPAPRDAHKYPHLKAPRSPAFNEAHLGDKPAWLRGRAKLTRAQISKLDQSYRLRAQAVRSVDRLLKGLRTTLAATGQADNTYVVFSSDNGYHMGEHRLPAGKQTAFATDIGRAARDHRAERHQALHPAASAERGPRPDLRRPRRPLERCTPSGRALAGSAAPRPAAGRLADSLAGRAPRAEHRPVRPGSARSHRGQPTVVPSDHHPECDLRRVRRGIPGVLRQPSGPPPAAQRLRQAEQQATGGAGGNPGATGLL